jgi:hypothetical protein
MTTEEKASIIFNYEANMKHWLFAKTDKERDRFYYVVTGMDNVLDRIAELRDEVKKSKAKIHDFYYEYTKNKEKQIQ